MTIFFLKEYSLLAGILFGSVSSIYVIYRYFSDNKEREAERQRMIAEATTYKDDYEDNDEEEYEEEEGDDDGDEDDELLEDAALIVAEVGYASTALLQSKLNIGAQRARLIQEQLEEEQIVGPPSASDRRQALLTPDGVAAHIKERYSNEEDLTEEEQAEADRNVEALMQELHELTGLDLMKQNIQRLVRLIQRLNNRYDLGQNFYYPRIHMIFATEPGTWEMRAANLISSIFYELSYLSERTVIEVNYQQLIDPYRRRSSQSTLDIVERARGGVLVIQDAYKLLEDDRTGQGREALDALFCCLENEDEEDDEILVIMTGAPVEMHRFMENNIEIGLYFTSVYALDNRILPDRGLSNRYGEQRNESYTPKQTKQGDEDNNVSETYRRITPNAEDGELLRVGEPQHNLEASNKYPFNAADSTTSMNEEPYDLDGKLNDLVNRGLLGGHEEGFRQLVQRVFEYRGGKAKGKYTDMPFACLVVMDGTGVVRTEIIEFLSQMYKHCGILSRGHIVTVSMDEIQELKASFVVSYVLAQMQQAKNGILVLRIPERDAARSSSQTERALSEALVKATDRYSSDTVIILDGSANDIDAFMKNSSVLRMRFHEVIQLSSAFKIGS